MKQCALLWASQPKCPSCFKSFTSDTLEAIFPKSFRRGDLRIQAIKNLQEQEMSLLPQSSIRLGEIKKSEQHVKVLREMRELIRAVENSVISRPQDNLLNLLFQIDQTRIKLAELGPINEVAKKEIIRRTVKCPGSTIEENITQECRGYIHKSGPGANLCNLCNLKLCTHCNCALPKDAQPHTCNQNDIASWHLIRDSTVPCPKCGTNIEKISGCNQMWCTIKDCSTAFDWVSGKIINGPIHNPHYHQWLSEGGQIATAGANLACANPRDIFTHANFTFLYNQLDVVCRMPELVKLYILTRQFFRVLPEIGYRNRVNAVYGPSTHEKLRFDYLENKITKEEWASKLSHRETLRIKNYRLSALNEMLHAACADIFSKLHSEIYKMSLLEDAPRNPRFPGGIAPPIVSGKSKIVVDHLTQFTQSLETLRIYHIREACRIVSDYSDKTVTVLYFTQREGTQINQVPNPYLTWSPVSVQTLNYEYDEIT
jgi:hypothetical protein